MVVLDELSSFKSAKSQRFKYFRKTRPQVKRVVGLTGTPASQGLIDLWAQVYLLDRGKALGKTLSGYREEYFVPDQRNATTVFSWKLKPFAEESIYEQLEGLCISMKAEDYLSLPDKFEIEHYIELPLVAKTVYKKLEKETLLLFKDGNVDAGTAAILVNKLLQLSGGAVYDDNGKARIFHDAKLDALDGLIEEANGQPVLVFYAYKHELTRLKARYKYGRSIDEPNAIEDWNAGKIPILFAHPASAGYGLNLQSCGHIIIWFTLPWSLEQYLQACARLYRLGQKEPVLIHHLIVNDTVDSHVLDVLKRKNEGQDAFLEAVKARIKEAAI